MTTKMKSIVCDIDDCARCGQNHPDLSFREMNNPPDEFRWFALCPANGDPITMRAEDEEAV